MTFFLHSLACITSTDLHNLLQMPCLLPRMAHNTKGEMLSRPGMFLGFFLPALVRPPAVIPLLMLSVRLIAMQAI